MRSVAITRSDYEFLRRSLFTSDGKENAALLVCGIVKTNEKQELLVREVVPVPSDAYTERLSYHLEIAPRFINSVIDKCVRKGFGIITTHSHPTSDAAHYSSSDDGGEGRLFKVFSDLLGPGKHGSLLLTRTDTIGRFPAARRFVPLDRLSVVGPRLSRTYFGRSKARSRTGSSATQHRQVLAFGTEGQALLESLQVGIVGLGGTGSAVAEQLIRIGVQKLVLVDPDEFEPSNLSRLYGSRFTDTKKPIPKTQIVARLMGSIAPSGEARQIQDSVVRQSVLLELRDCDVIFACTDNDWSRSVLNRFAYQYLVPLIDLGIRITLKNGAVQGIGGRVARVGPETACLRCAHHLDPDRIRAESMPARQRDALVKEHYLEGVENPAPAVISFNTTMAGFAVSDLLLIALGIGDESRANELIYDGVDGIAFRVRPDPNPLCDICSARGLKGIGDLQVVSAYE